jgi:hypothetical protein
VTKWSVSAKRNYQSKANLMINEQSNLPNVVKLATMRFKTIIAEAMDSQPITLSLPADSSVQGFIVILKPALPSID